MPTHRPDLSELSISSLADLVGRAPETIRKALDGLEPARVDGRTRFYNSRQALDRIYGGDGFELDRERARLAREQADAQAMKNDLMRGKTGDLDEIETTTVAVQSAIVRRLLAMPHAAAPLVAAETTARACEEILMNILREALEQIADAEIVVRPPRKRRRR